MNIQKKREKFNKRHSLFKADGVVYKPAIISNFMSNDSVFLQLIKEEFPEHRVDVVFCSNELEPVMLLSKKVDVKIEKVVHNSPSIPVVATLNLKELMYINLQKLEEKFENINTVLSKSDIKQIETERENAEEFLDHEFENKITSDIQKKVLSKADKVGGYIDIELEKDGKTSFYKVPKLPFYYWAINARFFSDLPEKIGLAKWKPVSSVGLKMQNDCPYHSDWWFGMGFTRKDFENDHGDLMSQFTMKKWELQMEILSHEVAVLAGNKEIEADVLHYDDFKDNMSKVKEDKILILPSLDLKFETIILKAVKNGKGGVICESGGKAAHLSKVGREMNFPVIMVEDALEKYKNAIKLTLDPKQGKVTYFCGF